MMLLLQLSLLYLCRCYGEASFEHYNVSTKTWEKEWETGKWAHLGATAVERSKAAVIIAMLNMFGPPNARILDVGCGNGNLVDLLSTEQRKNYLGMDISQEAIKQAKQRWPDVSFLASQSESFVSSTRFDVIIFNEMLYYVDHYKVLQKYRDELLAPQGIIITSVWFSAKTKFIRDAVSKSTEALLARVDRIYVSGRDLDMKTRKRNVVSFGVEIFNAPSSSVTKAGR